MPLNSDASKNSILAGYRLAWPRFSATEDACGRSSAAYDLVAAWDSELGREAERVESNMSPVTFIPQYAVLAACGLLTACGGGSGGDSQPETSQTVAASNTKPVITGTPTRQAVVGVAYEFLPEAIDADGDTLTFLIENRPEWATFSPSTGKLAGTPEADSKAVYAGIKISVTDGDESAALPLFDLSVLGVEPATAENAAPIISGTPDSITAAGNSYEFTPQGFDPDGQTVVYSVANLPPWAEFDEASGRLSGTPTAKDIGVFPGILIEVSDSELDASLPVFSITVQEPQIGAVTLSWTPPTRNEDGTPLRNLAGYRIYYGRYSEDLSLVQELPNPGITRSVVESLAPGTWQFAVTAYNTDGIESDRSARVSKTIP